MKFSEEQMERFAAPISDTEDQKCKNALNMVRDALKDMGYADDNDVKALYPDTSSYAIEMRFNAIGGNARTIKLFVQGSYANRTNIVAESDVDLAVVLESTFWGEYPLGITAQSYGFTDSSDNLPAFKNDVEALLRRKFSYGVTRHNKSIEVKGNTYRVDADTVPCGRFRDYHLDSGRNSSNYTPGIRIQPDDGNIIINYPEQHIANGIQKNKDTGYLFKKMVRIAKNIRSIMEEQSYQSAKGVSSFVIESLLWNVPADVYKKYPSIYRYSFDEVIRYLYENKEKLALFHEINGIKYLNTDDISRLDKCRAFIDDLHNFFEYDI